MIRTGELSGWLKAKNKYENSVCAMCVCIFSLLLLILLPLLLLY